jgi:hypothetical protein
MRWPSRGRDDGGTRQFDRGPPAAIGATGPVLVWLYCNILCNRMERGCQVVHPTPSYIERTTATPFQETCFFVCVATAHAAENQCLRFRVDSCLTARWKKSQRWCQVPEQRACRAVGLSAARPCTVCTFCVGFPKAFSTLLRPAPRRSQLPVSKIDREALWTPAPAEWILPWKTWFVLCCALSPCLRTVAHNCSHDPLLCLAWIQISTKSVD